MFIAVALLAEIMAPYDPLAIRIPDRQLPPIFFGGSWAHPFGTDETGRDILSRLMFGARISLLVAAASLFLGAVLGVTVGIMSGYAGGRTDTFLMRLTDLTLSLPVVVFALLFVTVFGPNVLNVIVAITLTLWSRYARLVRGETLVIREQEYVALAEIAGASPLMVAWTHILPNVASSVLVLASLQAGTVILTEASLSFLGAGVPPPAPAWGSMAAVGRDYLQTSWWIATMPGIAILLVVLALNMLGDWLRDRLDPRLKNL